MLRARGDAGAGRVCRPRASPGPWVLVRPRAGGRRCRRAQADQPGLVCQHRPQVARTVGARDRDVGVDLLAPTVGDVQGEQVVGALAQLGARRPRVMGDPYAQACPPRARIGGDQCQSVPVEGGPSGLGVPGEQAHDHRRGPAVGEEVVHAARQGAARPGAPEVTRELPRGGDHHGLGDGAPPGATEERRDGGGRRHDGAGILDLLDVHAGAQLDGAVTVTEPPFSGISPIQVRPGGIVKPCGSPADADAPAPAAVKVHGASSEAFCHCRS